jgi:hypothetical protein
MTYQNQMKIQKSICRQQQKGVKMAYQKSEYENYILVSQHTKMLGGTYPKYIKTKEFMSSLNSMVSKQSNTYIYNGESYVSSLTSAGDTKDTISI